MVKTAQQPPPKRCLAVGVLECAVRLVFAYRFDLHSWLLIWGRWSRHRNEEY